MRTQPSHPTETMLRSGLPLSRSWRFLLFVLGISSSVDIATSAYATVTTTTTTIPLPSKSPRRRSVVLASSSSSPLPSKTTERRSENGEDVRPHEQRRVGPPRAANRSNHAFKRLHRRDDDDDDDDVRGHDVASFLVARCGYAPNEVRRLAAEFPPLLSLDVSRRVAPSARFLERTLGGGRRDATTTSTTGRRRRGGGGGGGLSARCRSVVPAAYYGVKLDRALAPRHAYLWWTLGRDPRLLDDPARFAEFLRTVGGSSSRFAALCDRWAGRRGDRRLRARRREGASDDVSSSSSSSKPLLDAFEKAFRRGTLSTVRGAYAERDVVPPAELSRLLIVHGADPFERDARGATLLHHAAGAGDLDVYRVLEEYWNDDDDDDDRRAASEVRAARDGATPLHWAAAGVGVRDLGTGGHPDLCRHVLASAAPDAVNAVTKDGNTVLMWAAWAAATSDEVVNLLLREHGADVDVANRHGCTVAHWAAVGGNVDVCRRLRREHGARFVGATNHAGNTPLSHALDHGRRDVVEWLMREERASEEEGGETEETRARARRFLAGEHVATTTTTTTTTTGTLDLRP